MTTWRNLRFGLALGAILMALGWHTWDGVRAHIRRYDTRTFDVIADEARLSHDERHRRAMGPAYEAYLAIVGHVPLDGVVAFVSPRDELGFPLPEAARAFRDILVTTYPRTTDTFESLSKIYVERPEDVTDKHFVLSWERAPFPLTQHFQLVAEGESFTLWRFDPETR